MLRCLMASFAVASRAIRARNVPRVQIDVKIYAFDSDVGCEGAFSLLKVVTHLYRLVE